jgi:hypothetical protein
MQTIFPIMFVSYSHHINVFWAFFSFHVWHFSVVILQCYIIDLFKFSFIWIFYLGCWSWESKKKFYWERRLKTIRTVFSVLVFFWIFVYRTTCGALKSTLRLISLLHWRECYPG